MCVCRSVLTTCHFRFKPFCNILDLGRFSVSQALVHPLHCNRLSGDYWSGSCRKQTQLSSRFAPLHSCHRMWKSLSQCEWPWGSAAGFPSRQLCRMFILHVVSLVVEEASLSESEQGTPGTVILHPPTLGFWHRPFLSHPPRRQRH